ncbi:MAG: hypothetical protein H0W07_09280 [Chloroflexi bacterium]|nr:hypothetical protein [Chloroflexota bacterium]
MPDIEYAFLADAADARPGHKFAVLGGGVSRLGGGGFPLRHPHLAIVVGLLVTITELGTEHDLRFVLLTPDGSELATASATVLANGPRDGGDSVLTFSLDLWNLAFPVPGDYSLRILVDGNERKRLPLIVEERAAKSGAPDADASVLADGPTPPFPPPTGQA